VEGEGGREEEEDEEGDGEGGEVAMAFLEFNMEEGVQGDDEEEHIFAFLEAEGVAGADSEREADSSCDEDSE
jgi:hypothetical protein